MGGRDPEHPAGVSWNWLGHFRGLGYPWGFDTLELWCLDFLAPRWAKISHSPANFVQMETNS